MLKIKRIYDIPNKDDGYRILIDRLWPRGISKEKALIDLWFKDIAPSTELRKYFNHDPDKFNQFKIIYTQELKTNPAINKLKKLINQNQKVTLLYGAKDPNINHAIVLLEFLKENK